jgi:predicted permease
MRGTDLWLRIRALRSRRRAEEDLEDELAFHLEMESRRKGLSQSQAKAAFGGVEQVREQCRDVRGLALLENLGRDLRYGLRMLRKSPAFTIVAVLSLAIGIGANTAVFTLVDAVLLRLLPVKHPEQLVVLQWGAKKSYSSVNSSYATGGGGAHSWSINVFAWRLFQEIRGRHPDFESVFGFSQMPSLTVAANGQALVTGGMAVTGNYFDGLGIGMAAGRPIVSDDDTAAGALAAVISYGLWERAFGLDPGVIGKTVSINSQLCTIVGVTPKGFAGVSVGGFWRAPQIDITLPIIARQQFETRGKIDWFGSDLYWVQAMGRLRHGATRSAAASQLTAILVSNAAESTRREMVANPPHVILEDGSQGLSMLRDTYRKPLNVLFAVVGLTLLMACTNLAALLLAHAAARRKEIMIRLATGAKRSRLIRQLLVEGALLAIGGALAGLALAWWGVRALVALVAAGPAPILIDVHPDLRIVAFTTVVAILTTLLFALAPAVRATGVDVARGLKEGTPASSSTRFGAIRVLVTVQIAVALLLLSGAALFGRTLSNLRSVRLGFNPHQLIVFDVAPVYGGYRGERLAQFFPRLLDRLRQVRGATGVTLVGQRLVDGIVSSGPIAVDGSAFKGCNVYFNWVGPDFFDVLQIPLVAGRALESRDLTPGASVGVVNEAAARKCFDGAALGKRYRRGDSTAEVVGVVKDSIYDRVRREPPPTVFFPYSSYSSIWPQMTVVVRTAGNSAEAVAGIRRAVAEFDRTLPLERLKTMETQIDDTLAQERLFASLVSLFGVITLALAGVGLYGLIAASVTGRTREIGVRMALGARRASVLRMVLQQVALTALAGIAIGLPATWALSRLIESQLFGVKPHDPAALAIAAVAIVAAAAAAAIRPALRAIQIDPVRALRYE